MQKILLCFLISFMFSLGIVPLVIKLIKLMKGKQSILSYVEKHKSKQGTLTMGGLIFIFGSIFSFIFVAKGNNTLALVALLTMLGFGLLGFLDDFIKIKFKQNLGLRAYQKFIGQVGLGLILGFFVYNSSLIGDKILIPFTDKLVQIGWWIIPFVMIFYTAVVNSVNFVDGLDGLAGSVTFVAITAFAFLIGIVNLKTIDSGFVGNAQMQEFYNLITLSAGVAGCILAFLILNCFPAKIFMGDTGSLALGGFLASMVSFSGQYLMIFIVGFMYVLTTLSIILQVGFYKLTKKRIFKMAPLHHHFEQCGIHENKIVVLYTIITLMLSVFSIILSI